jgi:hypothetical protein
MSDPPLLYEQRSHHTAVTRIGVEELRPVVASRRSVVALRDQWQGPDPDAVRLDHDDASVLERLSELGQVVLLRSAAWSAGRCWLPCRNRITDGEVSLWVARSVPKSVSAETTTRSSPRARWKISSVGGGLHVQVADVDRVVASAVELDGDRRRERVIDQEPHPASGSERRPATVSQAESGLVSGASRARLLSQQPRR